MTSFVQKIVTEKRQRLRICTLIVLCGLIVSLHETPLSAPVDQQEAALALHGLTVAIDPGHGGYDGGARAHDSGRWEKDVALEIALKTADALRARGAQVVLTRTGDICLAPEDSSGKARKRADLQRRLDIAREAGADVFLSIHLNEYRDRKESGPQVFYQRGANAGRLLAGALQESLITGLAPPKKRKAMAGDYYVLRGELPSALIECGFLSNAGEETLLLDGEYQNRIAESIADGLCEWFRLKP